MNLMKNKSTKPFSQQQSSSHDERFEKLAPLKDALHLCMRLVLSDLPENANILCVGAGTGAELIAMADAFPNWRFTAVEPAAPMLDKCRKRVDALGLTTQCQFHHGYLDSLSESEPFDAATSILVSQFITDTTLRKEYYCQIAQRLKSRGYLISADLAADRTSPQFKSLFDVWQNMHRFTGMPNERLEKQNESFGKGISVLTKQVMEDLISSCGFNKPTLFCQTLLIHAWFMQLNS